jgi:quercetin dioxygenase-like cupin family protein
MSTIKKIWAVNSEEGNKLSIAGGSYRIVISGEQTNGEFAVIEMTVPVGAGPPPHSHERIDESFYVLEGEVTFHSENGSYLATKGAFVNIPKGGLINRT